MTCRGGSRRSWHPRAQDAAQEGRRWGRGVEGMRAASGSRAEDRAGSWRKGDRMGKRRLFHPYWTDSQRLRKEVRNERAGLQRCL